MIRDPAYITDAGKSMLFAAGQINYTKAVLFGQDISHLTVTQIKALTSIGDPLLEVPVGVSDKGKAVDGSTVVLEATFQNTNLKADLPYKALGFFAKKDDGEKLIAVGVANNGAHLDAGSPDGVATDAADFKLAIKIGDATTVTAVVDPAGSVTPATLNAAVNDATNKLADLIGTKANSADVANDVKSLQDKIDTKANTADVTASLDTKADKATTDQISKDVATKASQADLDSTNQTVATKADQATTYTKDEVDKALSAKDDIADVDKKLATKANATDVASDVKSLQDIIATKANSTDVTAGLATKADQTSLDATNKVVATKADKSVVDAEIAKIDFTPYAKTADVNADLDKKADKTDVANSVKSLQTNIDTKASLADMTDKLSKKADATNVTTQISNAVADKATKDDVDAINKTLATKANAVDVYSRVELDKKLLAMSTDTSGKVSADQVSAMIAGKADKKDVDTALESKANIADVNSELAKKDDITDVDAKLAKKANATDLSSLQGVVTNLKNTTIPIVQGSDGDDLFAYMTTQLRYYVNVHNCKNMPPASNVNWFTVEYFFENPNGDGIAVYRSPANEVWTAANNGSTYNNGWVRLANLNDLNDVKNTASQSISALNTALTNSYFRKQGMDENGNLVEIRGNATKQTNGGYAFDIWSSDWTSSKLKDVMSQVATLNSAHAGVQLDNPDFDTITKPGNYYVTNPTAANHAAIAGVWGNLIVLPGDNHRLEQIFFPDNNQPPYYRMKVEDSWRDWVQLASKGDISNLQSNVNVKANSADVYNKSQVDSAVNTKLNTSDYNNQVNITGALFASPSNVTKWDDLGGANGNYLRAIRTQGTASDFNSGDYDAGIAFGGSDTKAFISIGYENHTAIVSGGNGSTAWHEKMAWKSDISNLQNSVNAKANATDLTALQSLVTTMQNSINTLKQQVEALQTQNTDLTNQIAYIKQNYGLIKRFNDETTAMNWQKQADNHIAFVEGS